MVGRTFAAHEFAVDLLAIPELRVMILEALRSRAMADFLHALEPSSFGDGPLASLLTTLAKSRPPEDDCGFETLADQIVTEMAFCRMVDSFQAYLVDILRLIAEQHPHVVGLVDTKHVFDEVDKLSRRGGVWRLIEILSAIDADILSDSAQKARLEHQVEVRNLLVHHRGRVHVRFAERCGLDSRSIGRVYHLSDSFVRQASADLLSVVTSIDVVAVDRYGVQVTAIE